MNVYIDNQKIDVQIEAQDSLDTVIKTVENFLKDSGRVMFEIKVDGQDIGEIEAKDISSIEEVEFFTKSAGIIALESLQEMNDYIERLNAGVKLLVEELNNGDDKQKVSKMTLDAINGLEWVYNILCSIENISSINYGDIGFQKPFDRFQDILKDILESLEDKDDMLLADLMEYEIPDSIEEIKEYLPKIYDYILEEEKKLSTKS